MFTDRIKDMTTAFDTQDALKLWQRVVSRSLRELPYDLSQRQTGVLLTVYMSPPPHTIRSLAEQLNVSKPAICRSTLFAARRMTTTAAMCFCSAQ
jgi:hypothetical protein